MVKEHLLWHQQQLQWLLTLDQLELFLNLQVVHSQQVQVQKLLAQQSQGKF
jgi:hypothetical protein